MRIRLPNLLHKARSKYVQQQLKGRRETAFFIRPLNSPLFPWIARWIIMNYSHLAKKLPSKAASS